MGYAPAPTPTFGHPIPRTGKPYVWVTWLAKLLGEDQCRWSAWFKAHYSHAKFETMGPQLATWNREHTALMRRVRTELEENGWRCTTEDQNAFKIEGSTAVVAGKMDLVATFDPGTDALVIDGKTGRPKESDWWQVLIYLFAYSLQRVRPRRLDGRTFRGEVRYTHAPTVHLRADRVLAPNAGHLEDLTQMIQIIASDTAPARAPSRRECAHCNIGFADCPERFRDDEQPATPTPVVSEW